MDFLVSVSKKILFFFNEVSIYLLFGFIVAGVLHVLFPESIVRRHLGRNSFASVMKSTLFGMPIPLCSCGVVPVAASLKNSGASKGATISFLISTPQVGADSFMITYSLLGWVFGIFRIAASLITAISAGIVVNIIGGRDATQSDGPSLNGIPEQSFGQRLRSIFGYIEYDLLGSIANALLLGIIAAGIIGVLIPDGFFERHLSSHFLSMLLMLIAGIPMYVCASASTPIAASLIMKGISPGAALVFLLTGPATNAVTISTVIKTLGKKSTAVYLAAIAFVSLAMGYLLNALTSRYGFSSIILVHQHEMLPEWLKTGGAITLTLMLGLYYLKTKVLSASRGKDAVGDNKINLNVQGMTCMHCASNVKKAVESVAGISNVIVDLEGKKVVFDIKESDDIEKAKAAIVYAGYRA
jgi:uncharacterized membrane protein YraQ (UPF0718 family)/copper chaperone CopZ